MLYGYRQFHCIHKNMIFTKILQKLFTLDLILQIMNQTDHWLKEKNKKAIGLMEDELNLKKICWIKIKNLSLLHR